MNWFFIRLWCMMKSGFYMTTSDDQGQWLNWEEAPKHFPKPKLVSQVCMTPCDPIDGSPPGPSVHGILQARRREWVAIYSSRGIFPTQGSNPGLLHCRQILYHLSHQASPNLHQKKNKKGHCLVACCWSDPLHFPNPGKIIISEKYAQQINEMHRKLLCLQLVLVNRQLTGQGPDSSPQYPTVSCTTKSWRNWARKFLATHIH